ncbi:MAG: HEAT repeat domain-containing protein [Sulfitobacter sp.]|nr:HEAT repeat domain-containing protein [Sulfitobacter sp.]
MLMPALARADKARAADVLIGMLDDDDLIGHVIGALGQVGARDARSAIEQFLDHPKPWVRKEAKKVLAKLGA